MHMFSNRQKDFIFPSFPEEAPKLGGVRNAIAVCGFILTAFILPVIVFSMTSISGAMLQSGTIFFVMCLLFFASAMVALRYASPHFFYLKNFFYAYVYVNFGIATIIQVATKRFPFFGGYSDEIIYKAIFIICLGIASFEAGLFSYKKLQKKYTKQKYPESGHVSMPFPVILTVAVIGLSSFIVFFATGSYKGLFSATEGVLSTIGGGVEAGVLYQILTKITQGGALFAGLVFLLESRGKTNSKEKRIILVCVALVFILFALIVSNPVNTKRYWFATVFISICTTLGYCFFNRLLRWAPFIFICVYLFIYPLVGGVWWGLKKFSQGDTVSVDDVQYSIGAATNYEQFYMGYDFDSFQEVLNSVAVVQDHGVSFGKQLLGTCLFWLPRFVWPEKPLPTGMYIAQTQGYHFDNISCPLWAEGYIDFHILGTVALLFFFGLCVAFLDQRSRTGTDRVLYIAFSMIFAPYMVFFLRGTLMVTFGYFSPILLFLVITSLIWRVSTWTKAA